jgi:2'-5' RNA ligase
MNRAAEAFLSAEQYFANLWAQAQPKWRSGDVKLALMKDGSTIPVDYCISSVAFAAHQNPAASVAINAIRAELQHIAPDQYFYLPESTHITLLGCTQRFPTPDNFSDDYVTMIANKVADVLRDQSPVRMLLKGIGVLGNQVYIQVFPYDRRWETLRQQLGDALLAVNTAPMVHPNKAPIHMNLLRMTDTAQPKLDQMLDAVAKWRETEFCEFTVSTVDLVITDFVISPAHTTHKVQYQLT